MTIQSPAIFIATPCYGGMASAIYMRSLIALREPCVDRRIGLHIELGGGEALIGRARAAMMAKFLASPATHLMFIDADIGFSPAAVFRLLDAGRDVIGGVYPLADPAPPPGGQFPVASVGAGFMLISRSAARAMTDQHPDLQARLGDMHALGVPSAAMVFDSFTDPATGRHLSDHQAFCHRWRQLGGKVWADLDCDLRHVGAVVHP